MQVKLNSLREYNLRQAFNSLLIPRINKHFSGWNVAESFTLERTILQFRQADEFELLEAPDVLALSNKTRKTHTEVGESSTSMTYSNNATTTD